jgi:hypothetical protein
VRTSTALTQQVLEQSKDDIDQALVRVFTELYSRAPYPEEVDLAHRSIQRGSDPQIGLRLFIQGMMGANDFLYSY